MARQNTRLIHSDWSVYDFHWITVKITGDVARSYRGLKSNFYVQITTGSTLKETVLRKANSLCVTFSNIIERYWTNTTLLANAIRGLTPARAENIVIIIVKYKRKFQLDFDKFFGVCCSRRPSVLSRCMSLHVQSSQSRIRETLFELRRKVRHSTVCVLLKFASAHDKDGR